jgi:hypothetical protein
MKFGDHMVITREGEIMKAATKTFVKFDTLHQIDRYRESIKVSSADDALAHFLKLMDDYKQGNINDFGVVCYSDKQGNINRIDKVWAVFQFKKA